MKIPIPLTGGVNLLTDPRRIRDDEVAWSKNLVPVRSGVLSTRPALSVMANSADAATPDVILPIPYAGDRLLHLFWTGTHMTADLLSLQSGTGLTTLANFGSERFPWTFQFGNNLYVCTGPNADYMYPAGGSGHGTTGSFLLVQQTLAAPGTSAAFATFQGNNNDGIRPRVGCAYRQRVCWGNLGGAYKRYVIMSNNYKPDVIGDDCISANGRAFELAGGANGDEIVAMQEIMLTAIGSPVQSALLVLMRFGAYIITGQLDQFGGGGVNDMVVSRISFDTGCVSPWSVATSPYGLFWVGPDDIWFFAIGQVPTRVGTKLRPAILRLPPFEQARRTQAIYYDGFLRVGLPSEGQALDDTSPGGNPANMYFGDEWWLDLRPAGDGRSVPQSADEARWWGPQQFWANDTHGFVNLPVVATPRWWKDRTSGHEQLFGITVGYGGASYVSLGAQAERDDLSTPPFVSGPATNQVTTPDQNVYRETGSEVLVDLYCKEYDFGQPPLLKGYQSLYLTAWTSRGTRIQADILSGDGAPLSSLSKDVSDLSQSDFVLDRDALDGSSAGLSRTMQAISLYSSPTVRPIGQTIQPRIYTQSGFLIDSTNDELIIGTVGHNQLSFAIPHGIYATLSAIAAAIAASAGTSLTTGVTTSWAGFNSVDPDTLDPGMEGNLLLGPSGSVPVGTWGFKEVNSDGLNLALYFQTDAASTGTHSTAAQKAKTRALMGLFGFDTSATIEYTGPGDGTGAVNAAGPVFQTAAPIIEITGLELNANVIPRSP
jgi:hypothetical protein